MGFEKTGLSLEGKSAVVIGGTSGLAGRLSLGLANAGADVAASSRRQEQVDATAAEIEETGKRSLRVASDVADRASLEELLAASIKGFGKVDILINCAGKTKRAPAIDFPEDVWDDIMDTNLTGNAARLPGLWQAHAGARLRAHHQHRLAVFICRAV